MKPRSTNCCRTRASSATGRRSSRRSRTPAALVKIQEEYGSFDAYIWGFVHGKPIQNGWQTMAQLPAKTELSEAISRELKERGFSFVGPTIVYAFMQAVGLVNDHTVDCFRSREVAAAE
jgi:DNA-3-methyladenine glycosylase I